MKFIKYFVVFFSSLSIGQTIEICNNDYNLKSRVKIVEEISSYPNGEFSPSYDVETIYILNYEGYIITIEEKGFNGKHQKKEFKYDSENIITELIVTVDGKVQSTSTFIKNNNNQIEKIRVEDSNGRHEIFNYYEGNSLLPISGKEMDNEELTRSWNILYKNNLTNAFTQSMFGTKTQTLYQYNSNNDITEIEVQNEDAVMVDKQFFEYKYDNKSNWIESHVYDSDKKTIVKSKRKIQYW